MQERYISVAIPAMDEVETLPLTLADLAAQTWRAVKVYVCVNQPETWWNDGDTYHESVCRNNALLLQQLESWSQRLDLVVVDCSSPRKGWQGRRKGVGWARKRLLDVIVSECCNENELIVSMDADTRLNRNYLHRLALTFDRHPLWSAMAVPYYHNLSGDESIDRPLLRYECYMRHYLSQLLRIGNPYAFTAIGSAMAFTCRAYRRVGGITPLQGGEDFYLMQKFAKTGCVGLKLDGDETDYVPVFPSGRISRRVPFGTGPAVSMTVEEQTVRYPFFASNGFDDIARTYSMFPELYNHDVDTPMTTFLQRQLGTDDVWGPLRRNHTSRERFVHACVERVDGLRILQYLRSIPNGIMPDDAVGDFLYAPITQLNEIRNSMLQHEMALR